MTEIKNSIPVQILQTKGKGKALEDTVVEKPKPTNQVAIEYQLKAIEWIEPSLGGVRKLKVITQNGMFYKLSFPHA